MRSEGRAKIVPVSSQEVPCVMTHLRCYLKVMSGFLEKILQDTETQLALSHEVITMIRVLILA